MKLYPSAKHAIACLKKSGARAYIASEGIPVKQWDKLIRLGVSEVFDGAFISRKKDAAFFRRALKKVGVAPGDAVMVGDKLEKDVKPALEAGMNAVMIGKKVSSGKSCGKNLFFARSIGEIPGIVKNINL
ncbi:Glyceraldehyde 3-phosphate phosphatase [uncultured archaeon]|nr:Glyceraldehyde 3-phosphate phosphatase [uncultured archaeon]